MNGKFRHVIVSPEIIVSTEFHKRVLSKVSFTNNLRVTNIDEAHCLVIWGLSFRPDYAKLGILRGRLPRNVPITAASATMTPSHIMDGVRSTLSLSADAVKISVTNARPNVSLCVRSMQHSDESKADLRFLIPTNAECADDIPITLVYCNARTVTEICTDRTRDWAAGQGINPECIAFYHALIGEERKRELEDALERSRIRILYCTNAIGMVSTLTIAQIYINFDTSHRDVIFETLIEWLCGGYQHLSVDLYKNLEGPHAISTHRDSQSLLFPRAQ